mmetsp:Transcript_54487/g.129895  ORF Transcript_54487/g.129895 Transcript_54487/m.129895 type:complete len:282 (-) Transcript_54487:82-927(-)
MQAPPAKRRKPEVPKFLSAEVRDAAEYERRAKAGLLDTPGAFAAPAAPMQTHSGASAPSLSTPVVQQPNMASGGSSDSPPSQPNTTPSDQASVASPVPQQTGSAAPASSSSSAAPTAPAPAADNDDDDDEEEEMQELQVTKPQGGVYGLGAGRVEERAKKAIHLKMEPLKPGLPAFERTLTEEKQTLSIGGQRKFSELVVGGEAVSKKHCTIALVAIKGELALSITDSSTNGTWVNGQRLREKQKKYRLRSGDRLQLKSPDYEDGFGWTCEFGNTVAYFTR